MTFRRTWIVFPFLCLVLSGLRAQVTVRGRIEVEGGAKVRHGSIPQTVVWLTPVGADSALLAPKTLPNVQLRQRNKSFDPHILVIPAGTAVEFPNQDPFFHNVFSLFEGKRFDLGLYEAGSSRTVHFDRAGISYIFCNIHPEMGAVIITLKTPYYSVSTSDGQISIANVPSGKYFLYVWSDGTGPEATQPSPRLITVGENSASLGVIRVLAPNGSSLAHKNKYGRDYEAVTPDNPVYHEQP